MFTDPVNGDFTLQDNSPCINSGAAYFAQNGEIILDLDESEYNGKAPDMGAFEHICQSNIYDQCGECDGDNSVCTGCMDTDALNYNADYTID